MEKSPLIHRHRPTVDRIPGLVQTCRLAIRTEVSIDVARTQSVGAEKRRVYLEIEQRIIDDSRRGGREGTDSERSNIAWLEEQAVLFKRFFERPLAVILRECFPGQKESKAEKKRESLFISSSIRLALDADRRPQ